MLGLLVTATYVGQSLLIALGLGMVLDRRPITELVPVAVGVLVLQGLRAVTTVAREAQGIKAAARVKAQLRDQVYRQLLAMGPIALGRDRSGRLTATFVDGIETMERFVAGFVPQLVVSVLAAVVIVTLIFTIDPVVGTVVLLAAIVVPVAPVISRKVLRPVGNAWWDMYRAIYAESLDAVQGMTTLKAFGAARRRGSELHDRAEAFARASVRLSVVSTVFMGVVGLAESAGIALSVAVAAVRHAQGELEAAGLLAVLLLSRECFRPLQDLQIAFHQGYSALSTSEGIFEVLDGRPGVAPTGILPAKPAGPPRVAFDNLSFGYEPGQVDVVRDLTLTIEPGETVAVVGRSGAGKTTLVSLLLRFADPADGAVQIDGHDIRDYELASLRELVAVVAQDTYLFHGTVRDNLRLARPEASDEDLRAVLGAAGATEFVAGLPGGIDTVIGERGIRLSGGERQRIAIARALLKDAPILVLDEATSAVDAVNEASIQAALGRLREGRTTLVIAHRLSTIRGADRIVVLDRGRIVESGAHDELMARKGRYADLVAAQSVGVVVRGAGA